MSSTPPTGGRLLVEPLEARIAPTGLLALANDPASSSNENYVTYATPPTAGHLGFEAASKYLGAGAPSNVFALKMSGDGSNNGDTLLIFNATTGFNPNTPFLKATDKNLIAFFKDTNGDGQVQTTELVGLSLTKKSSASLNGSVNGDIVTNLSKDGLTVNLASVGKQGFAISGLSINGNVTGNILAGGSINDVRVTGNLNNVLAGTATNGVAYNFTGNAGTVTGTIVEGAFPVAKIGASITGLTVTSLTPGATIHAGDGGLGAIGGDVSTLAVLANTGAFNVLAGNGGVGTDTIKGGGGGNIAGVTIVGVSDAGTGVQQNQLINMHAGNGGEADAFKGGNGGSVTGVATGFNLGFDTSSNTGIQSPDLLTQNILVHGGDGGTGLRGGKGGDVSFSRIYNAAPDDGVVTNGIANAEIQVIAGHGGLPISNTQGHGGNGGNVSQVFVQDQYADITNPNGTITSATDSVLVQGGDGGMGKNGGSLSGIDVLGSTLIVQAGNGADGINTGGIGGSLNTVTIRNLTNLFTHQLTLNAGSGGASQLGAGGFGGSIDTVSMLDSDLHDLRGQPALIVNGGTHANGGSGGNGVGGAGGFVSNVQLTDTDVGNGFATVAVRSGVGGDGRFGGGDGGNVSQFQMFGINFRASTTGGAGGNVLQGGDGNGGNGGGLDTVGFSSQPSVDQIQIGQAITDALVSTYALEVGTATGGNGGNGTLHGGTGGTLATVNLRMGYNISLASGFGGTGGSQAGGDGGAITASAGVSLGGAVSLVAGDGSGVGSFAANGGDITGVIASAQTNISMLAGSGGFGGAGGSITNSGTTPNPLYINPVFSSQGVVNQTVSNFGDVTITAGAGKSANGVAGAGGSVTGFSGSIGLGGAGDFSTSGPHTTAITAGAGGGGDGATASGAGGIVDSLKLTGNNSTSFFGVQFVLVDGGNAGQAAGAKRGGAGGGVSNATIFNLDAGTFVQHIAAGDGATALKHGGAGGTITEIHVGRPGDMVANDIGIRSGEAFGYAVGSAGGLFAGVGGTFTKLGGNGKQTNGLNGDVTNVTATAIASIVAGKTSTIHLVNRVTGIDLEGNVATAANADGSFNNFDTAILIGSVQNPTAAGASTYKAGDGLIAAFTFTQDRDFSPEALLTVNAAGALVFVDPQQPGNPVVTPNIPLSAAL